MFEERLPVKMYGNMTVSDVEQIVMDMNREIAKNGQHNG